MPNSHDDWPTVKFGDMVRQMKEKADPETNGLERYVAGSHMNTDDLHIRDWGTIGEGYLGPAFIRLFRKGQTLYGSRRTYLRKVAYAEWDGICANTTYVLEPHDPQVLLPELLPFIMQTESFVEHSVRNSRGSVNPYVNFKDIAWYEFTLPPLNEQQRIAEILGAADSADMKNWHSLEQLNSLKRVMLHNLFRYGINHDKYKKTRYGEIPTRWETTVLGEIVNFLDNQRIPFRNGN